MSATGKAERFLQLCKQHGWTGDFKLDYDEDYAFIDVRRNGEHLRIEWVDNQWIHPGYYELAGTKVRVNRAKDAERIIAGQPDLAALQRRQRRAQRAARANGVPVNGSEQAEYEQHHLPFNINDPEVDAEVLKFCRGGELAWRNSITGATERARIPTDLNRDLKNVYYIAESSAGRPYLSFMSEEGVFHAVAFDQMLGVRSF